MQGYLDYSTFQSYSLPVVKKSTEPTATICAQQISHHVALWLLRNPSIRVQSKHSQFRTTADVSGRGEI
jgi:hypothetical protein